MLSKDKLSIIRKWYPNANTTIDSVSQLIDFAEDMLQLEPAKIMVADCICGDDISNIQYPARAREFFGSFSMGGLGGFPFAGLTGMSAYASHVPDDGAVLIYYGPHIGISKSGTVGEVQGIMQTKNSDCCGATIAALANLLNNDIVEGNVTAIDYQMNIIEQILLSGKSRITAASSPLFEATEVIYEAIDRRIMELIEKANYKCRYVILMGAILINSDRDMGSFSSTRRFDYIDLATKRSSN